MTKTEYKINAAYNLFLTQVILWSGLRNRINNEESIGFKPVKNKEVMNKCYDKASRMSEHLDLTDLSIYTSWYPSVDDKAVVSEFLATLEA